MRFINSHDIRVNSIRIYIYISTTRLVLSSNGPHDANCNANHPVPSARINTTIYVDHDQSYIKNSNGLVLNLLAGDEATVMEETNKQESRTGRRNRTPFCAVDTPFVNFDGP